MITLQTCYVEAARMILNIENFTNDINEDDYDCVIFV